MKPMIKIVGAGALVGLLLGFAAGVEWATRDAQQDLAQMQAGHERERESWQQERQTLSDLLADAQMQAGARCSKSAELASPDEPQQKDPGNLLPEIEQPGAETLEQQQAAAAAAAAERQRQIEAAASVLRTLTR